MARKEHDTGGVRTAGRVAAHAAAVTSDPRWAAVVGRDGAADDAFVYSVKTTGVYCRPSCGARPPRPHNVAFHATAQDAQRAGFRACKRCLPDQPPLAVRRIAMVQTLCRIIEGSVEPPTLAALASHAGLSVFHTQRTFKAVTGVTPKAYALAHRTKQVHAALRREDTVTAAIYTAGFSGSGRFYAQTVPMLGMTPTRFRQGGADTEIRVAVVPCVLGMVLVAATERGVCAILLGDDPDALRQALHRDFPRARIIAADPSFDTLVAQVVRLVQDPGQGVTLPLDIRGTAFQQRVWTALQAIPAGTTASYAEIAAALGAPRSARAVAQACAANRLAVAIPCHRVVRSDGTQSGYRWGADRKRALIDREDAGDGTRPCPDSST